MKLLAGLTLIALAIVLFICCPIALIWALNTLFTLHIPLNFGTWLAAAVLFYSFSRPSSSFSSFKSK